MLGVVITLWRRTVNKIVSVVALVLCVSACAEEYGSGPLFSLEIPKVVSPKFGETNFDGELILIDTDRQTYDQGVSLEEHASNAKDRTTLKDEQGDLIPFEMESYERSSIYFRVVPTAALSQGSYTLEYRHDRAPVSSTFTVSSSQSPTLGWINHMSYEGKNTKELRFAYSESVGASIARVRVFIDGEEDDSFAYDRQNINSSIYRHISYFTPKPVHELTVKFSHDITSPISMKQFDLSGFPTSDTVSVGREDGWESIIIQVSP